MAEQGYQAPNHTQMPNILLDEHMAKMGEAELRVVLAVCRKTFGWHKDKDMISFSQLQQLTGLSRESVSTGVQQALARGVLGRTKRGNSFEYWLVVNLPDQSTKPTDTSRVSRPIEAQNGRLSRHTKERQPKEINKESESPEPLREMMAALGQVMGWDMDISANWAKLGKLAKSLQKAGYSSENVLHCFGPDGTWYSQDWRGKKGDLPNMKSIAEEIGKLSKKTVSIQTNGNALNEAVDPEEVRRAIEERESKNTDQEF